MFEKMPTKTSKIQTHLRAFPNLTVTAGQALLCVALNNGFLLEHHYHDCLAKELWFPKSSIMNK